MQGQKESRCKGREEACRRCKGREQACKGREQACRVEESKQRQGFFFKSKHAGQKRARVQTQGQRASMQGQRASMQRQRGSMQKMQGQRASMQGRRVQVLVRVCWRMLQYAIRNLYNVTQSYDPFATPSFRGMPFHIIFPLLPYQHPPFSPV
jgi:hypothetical protein